MIFEGVVSSEGTETMFTGVGEGISKVMRFDMVSDIPGGLVGHVETYSACKHSTLSLGHVFFKVFGC